MPTPARALLPLFALSVAGAAELMPINDLRVGVTVTTGPAIEEGVRTNAGTAHYTWKGNAPVSMRYQVDYFNGLSRRGLAVNGFLWGVGVLFSDTDIRPESYDSNVAASFTNNRKDIELQYRQYGASLYAGYATSPQFTEYGEYTWEFLPVARGGYATAQTTDSAGDTYQGTGAFWELGGLVGWTLQDQGWILALRGGWAYGQAETSTDITGGKSTMTLVHNGPEATLQVGARF